MKKLLLFSLSMFCIVYQCPTSFAYQHDYPTETAKADKPNAKKTIKENPKKEFSNAATKTSPSTTKKENKLLWIRLLTRIGIVFICVVFITYIYREGVGSFDAIDESVFDELVEDNASAQNEKDISPQDFPRDKFAVETIGEWICYVTKKDNRPEVPLFEKYSSKYVTYNDIKKDKGGPWYRSFFKNGPWVDKKFKKIHSVSDSHEIINGIHELWLSGYDFIFTNHDEYLQKAFFIHPKLKENFIQYLQCLKRDAEAIDNKKSKHEKRETLSLSDDLSFYELGLLFSYPQEEVFAFTFASKLTKKAYPSIKQWQKQWDLWEWGDDEDEMLQEMLSKGSNRLKAVFGKQLPYILSGKPLNPSNLGKKYQEIYETNKYTIENGWQYP